MERKKTITIAIISFIALVVILIAIFGDSPSEAAQKQKLLTEQAIKEDSLKAEQKESQCPQQGTFQSDWSYCIELCMIGKSNQDFTRGCEQICDMGERIGKLDDKIQQYKCEKCNQGCTEDQLNQKVNESE